MIRGFLLLCLTWLNLWFAATLLEGGSVGWFFAFVLSGACALVLAIKAASRG